MSSHISEPTSSGWRGFERPAAAALFAVLFFVHGTANAQDKGTLNPEPLPPLAGQGGVPPQDDPRRASDALHRLLFQRLPRGRRRVANQRRNLASDARFTQPQLGTSEPGRVPRTIVGARGEERLARTPARRHVTAAWWRDAQRACEPSDRLGCGYLAHAHARPRADEGRAGRNDGH